MKFLIITLLICILAVSGKPEPESAKPEPETDSKAAEPEAESEPEGEAETCIGEHCFQEKSEEKDGKAEPKSGFKFADNLLSSFSN